MAKETYAYVSMAGETYIKLGNDGVELRICVDDASKAGGESKVGTLYVGRGGVNWKPAGHQIKGDLINWGDLERFHD